MKLHSITLDGRYKGLSDQHFNFEETNGGAIAFIGLNGSGKSQLLELIGETFAYLERWQRDDFQNSRTLPFSVKIEYTIDSEQDLLQRFRISIQPDGTVVALTLVPDDGWYNRNPNQVRLPRFILGYSSGLNENLQRGFMKNAAQYFEIQRIRAKRRREIQKKSPGVEELLEINRKHLKNHPNIFTGNVEEPYEIKESDTPVSKHVYLDYDNIPILLTCLTFLNKDDVDNILGELEFKYPSSVKIRYNFRSGPVEEDALKDIELIRKISGEGNFRSIGRSASEDQFEQYGMEALEGEFFLDFNDTNVGNRLREAHYDEAITWFNRLLKTQLLGVKNWSANDRKNLLKDNFFETVKKPLKSKLPLTVVDLKLANEHGQEVSYDDLSDGEVQLMTILTLARIFGKEESLILLDEPETHYNPSWRTNFFKLLVNAAPSLGNPEPSNSHFFVSTHSPFIISSLKKENVFRFLREKDGTIQMQQVESQTYGASFDVLIKELFGLKSLISQSVIDEIREQLKKGEAKALTWIENNLGLSAEKAYLIQKLKNKTS